MKFSRKGDKRDPIPKLTWPLVVNSGGGPTKGFDQSTYYINRHGYWVGHWVEIRQKGEGGESVKSGGVRVSPRIN